MKYCFSFLIIVILWNNVDAQFRSRQSGNWNISDTWEEFVSGSWTNSSNFPNSSTVDVTVRSNHSVTVNVSAQSVKNLTIESGGKLWTNTTSLNLIRYINLYGNLRCDGQFGNGATANADGASINLAGNNDTIFGSGLFQPRRIRKHSTTTLTNFVLMMDATVVYSSSTINGRTGIFNNNSSTFNIFISSGITCSVLGSIAMDGLSGAGGASQGGYYISGSLMVENDVFIRTNNAAGQNCRFEVLSGGVLEVGNEIITKGVTTGNAYSILKVDSAGSLILKGPDAIAGLAITAPGIRDSLIFHPKSLVSYSKTGNQTIQTNVFQGYGRLHLRGSGTKELNGNILINDELRIGNGTEIEVTNSNYDINLKGNWINGNLSTDGFRQQSGKVFFTGTSVAQTLIDSNGVENFYNLEINNPDGMIILHGGVDVKNLLTLNNGIIQTSSSALLTLEDGASVSPIGGKSTSYVSGPMRWEHEASTEVVFPLGKGSQWGRIGVLPRNVDARGATTRTFEAEYFNTGYGTYTINTSQSPSLDHVSFLEYWNLSEITSASGNDLESKVKCFYTAFSETSSLSAVRDSLVVAHWISGSSHWQREGTIANHNYSVASSTDGWVQSDWVTTFSPFTLGTLSGNNPLPVSLVDYKWNCQNSLLQWSTATELNTQKFIIALTSNNQVLEKYITAQGFSNNITNYALFIPESFEYLTVKSYDFDGYEEILFTVFNCPKTPSYRFSYTSGGVKRLLILPFKPIVMIDMMGRMTNIPAQNTSDFWNQLRKGMYLLIDNRGNSEKIILY